MNLKLKLLLGTAYLICFSALMFVIFSSFDFKDLSDVNFFKNNQQLFNDFKSENTFLLLFLFSIFSIIWILLLGFGTPLALFAGFVFGKWVGTLVSVVSLSVGATLLYCLANFFFKDLIKNKLSKRIEKFINLFNKNEFLYFMIFRFTGGAGIPFAIQNVLPVVFNMKIKNYIYATFLGLVPTVFVINSLGEGIENLIENNKNIDYKNIFTDPGIYVPLIGVLIILLIPYFIKKKIFKK